MFTLDRRCNDEKNDCIFCMSEHAHDDGACFC